LASPLPCGLHAQSPCVDQFKDSFYHHSSYPHVLCSYYQSFDVDANSYRYYDISDKCYARLNAMIETLNERHTYFVSKMRECGPLHKNGPSLASLTVEASFYDDYKPSLPLEADSTVDTPLTGLEEVIDPILISLPFVVLSLPNTPRDTAIGDLTLLASPLPLAQCAGLETGELSKGDASILKMIYLIG